MLNPSNLTPIMSHRAPRNIGRHVEWFRRENHLCADDWRRFTDDLSRAIASHPLSSNGTLLRGHYGEGAPIFTAESVIFNGNTDQRRWYNRQRKSSPTFVCDPGEADDAHDAFDIHRHRTDYLPDAYQLHEEIETAGKPYTAIVLVALILMRHHLPEQTRIMATGCAPREWHAAGLHVYAVTGRWTIPPELAGRTPQLVRTG